MLALLFPLGWRGWVPSQCTLLIFLVHSQEASNLNDQGRQGGDDRDGPTASLSQTSAVDATVVPPPTQSHVAAPSRDHSGSELGTAASFQTVIIR